jgi:hypothetical protein
MSVCLDSWIFDLVDCLLCAFENCLLELDLGPVLWDKLWFGLGVDWNLLLRLLMLGNPLEVSFTISSRSFE